ncbi:MAG: PilN domain-containing protein [Bdellovibrionales bacterium]|nr:PilN domain-containing protein [Bdellovibrionales bacterium]
MKLDLRKTKAATVVDDIGGDDFVFYDEKPGFLSNITIDPWRVFGFFFRVGICAAGVIALRYVEQQNLDKLNRQKTIVQGELDQLIKTRKDKEKQVESFGYIVEKSKEFYNKLDIMQGLADSRLLPLTGLDYIQNVIPEEVWLREIEFRNKEFDIKGASTTNKQVQNFIEKLEGTQLFSSVTLQQSREEKDNKNYIRRNFTIKSTLK